MGDAHDVDHVAAGPKGTVVVTAFFGTAWIGTRSGGWTVIGSSFAGCSISPVDASTLLCLQKNVAHPSKLVRSADGGKTFATVIDGLDADTALVPVFVRDGAAAFIRDTKGISRSVDGGATWTHVADLPPDLPASAKIGLAAESATVLYAGQYRIELPAP